MANFVIYTDSACDIQPADLAAWGVPYRSLTFRFTDSEKEYSNDDMNSKEFYDRMRAGGVAKTAAVNSEAFAEEFDKILAAGNDLLYLGFSSGLSTTYNSACIAAEDLLEKYPQRKVYAVDTLSASMGQGLLVWLAAQLQKQGKTRPRTEPFIPGLPPPKASIPHSINNPGTAQRVNPS